MIEKEEHEYMETELPRTYSSSDDGIGDICIRVRNLDSGAHDNIN